jgi:hypothetical protein
MTGLADLTKPLSIDPTFSQAFKSGDKLNKKNKKQFIKRLIK